LGAWQLIALGLTAGLLVLCFLPADATPEAPVVNFDKVLHVVAFATVTFAWRRAGLSMLQALILGLALGVVTEGGQTLLANGRQGDVLDLAADVVGVLLALLLTRGGGDA
jgi:VanZ family protein